MSHFVKFAVFSSSNIFFRSDYSSFLSIAVIIRITSSWFAKACVANVRFIVASSRRLLLGRTVRSVRVTLIFLCRICCSCSLLACWLISISRLFSFRRAILVSFFLFKALLFFLSSSSFFSFFKFLCFLLCLFFLSSLFFFLFSTSYLSLFFFLSLREELLYLKKWLQIFFFFNLC